MSKTTEQNSAAGPLPGGGTLVASVVVRKEPGDAVAADWPAERRAKPRFSVALSVTLFGDHNFYTGMTENVSEGGLFIRTQNVLPIGTRVKVEFTLPTAQSPLTIIGVVRWTRSPDAMREEYNNFGSVENASSNPGMGIQFEDVDPKATDAIVKFTRYRKPEFYEP